MAGTLLALILCATPCGAVGEEPTNAAVRAIDIALDAGYAFGFMDSGLRPYFDQGAWVGPASRSHDFPLRLRLVLPVTKWIGARASVDGGMTLFDVDATATTPSFSEWSPAVGFDAGLFARNPKQGAVFVNYGFTWFGGDVESTVHGVDGGLTWFLTSLEMPFDLSLSADWSLEVPSTELFDLRSEQLDLDLMSRWYAGDRYSVGVSGSVTSYLGNINDASRYQLALRLGWLAPAKLGRALTVNLVAGGGQYVFPGTSGAGFGFTGLLVSIHRVDVESLVELARHY